MPALQIRDFPASLHSQLEARARKERRTIAQEATVLLAVALAMPDPRERRRAILADVRRNGQKFDFSRIPTPEQLIREDRDR